MKLFEMAHFKEGQHEIKHHGDYIAVENIKTGLQIGTCVRPGRPPSFKLVQMTVEQTPEKKQ